MPGSNERHLTIGIVLGIGASWCQSDGLKLVLHWNRRTAGKRERTGRGQRGQRENHLLVFHDAPPLFRTHEKAPSCSARNRFRRYCLFGCQDRPDSWTLMVLKEGLGDKLTLMSMPNSEREGTVWVTLGGLPLTMHFDWPFHRSTSGADFWVLHSDIRVVGSGDLHALVAVNLSATVREVLPSLEPKDAEPPVVNALRKEVDRNQIEFVRQGKLLPLAFSSRHYDFKRQRWVFGKASDDVIATLLERKVYWQTKLNSSGATGSQGATGVWIGDPAEAQYLETSTEHLIEVAGRLLAADGLLHMNREWVEATPGLMGRAEQFESAMRRGLEEVERKRVFERG